MNLFHFKFFIFNKIDSLLLKKQEYLFWSFIDMEHLPSYIKYSDSLMNWNKKEKLIFNSLNLFQNKNAPWRGIEPRSPAWQAGILTTILSRIYCLSCLICFFLLKASIIILRIILLLSNINLIFWFRFV